MVLNFRTHFLMDCVFEIHCVHYSTHERSHTHIEIVNIEDLKYPPSSLYIYSLIAFALDFKRESSK